LPPEVNAAAMAMAMVVLKVAGSPTRSDNSPSGIRFSQSHFGLRWFHSSSFRQIDLLVAVAWSRRTEGETIPKMVGSLSGGRQYFALSNFT
jgi:hypothetical protein